MRRRDPPIKIEAVTDKENGWLLDIVIKYPEHFNLKDISFAEAGLISAYKIYALEETEYGTPRTAIEFYGELEGVIE